MGWKPLQVTWRCWSAWRTRSPQYPGGGALLRAVKEVSIPRVDSRRKDMLEEPAGYTEAGATPGLNPTSVSQTRVHCPVHPFHCPFLVSFMFRSHHITINSPWVLVVHPNSVLLDVQKPVPTSPCLCLYSQETSPSSPQLQRTKSTRCAPHQDSLCSVGAEVLSTDSVQNLVTTPLKKSREVEAFSTFLSCCVWEPRRLALSTPVSLGVAQGLGGELVIKFLCTKK